MIRIVGLLVANSDNNDSCISINNSIHNKDNNNTNKTHESKLTQKVSVKLVMITTIVIMSVVINTIIVIDSSSIAVTHLVTEKAISPLQNVLTS